MAKKKPTTPAGRAYARQMKAAGRRGRAILRAREEGRKEPPPLKKKKKS